MPHLFGAKKSRVRPRTRHPRQSRVSSFHWLGHCGGGRADFGELSRPNFAMRAVFAPPLAAQAPAPTCPENVSKCLTFWGGQKVAGTAQNTSKPTPIAGSSLRGCEVYGAGLADFGERFSRAPTSARRAVFAPPLPAQTPASAGPENVAKCLIFLGAKNSRSRPRTCPNPRQSRVRAIAGLDIAAAEARDFGERFSHPISRSVPRSRDPCQRNRPPNDPRT